MFFYYSLFFVLSLFSVSKDKLLSKAIFSWFISLFFIFSFIRWNVGPDWESYYTIFNNSLIEIDYREKGFAYLNYFIRSITSSYTFMLFIESNILFFCWRRVLKEFSFYPLVSLLSFLALQRGGMFYTRQILAVSLCVFATTFIIKNEKKKAIIIWLLAISLHTSAIVYGFMFILNKIELDMKKIVIGVMFSFVFHKVILRIADMIPSFYIFSRILRYSQEGNELFGYGNGLSKGLIILKSSINRFFVLGVLIIIRRRYKDDNLFNLIFNSFVTTFCIFISFSQLSMALTRIGNYFECMEVFVYPYILDYPKKKYTKMLVLLFVIFYLFLRLTSNIRSYYNCLVPYKTIFF